MGWSYFKHEDKLVISDPPLCQQSTTETSKVLHSEWVVSAWCPVPTASVTACLVPVDVMQLYNNIYITTGLTRNEFEVIQWYY